MATTTTNYYFSPKSYRHDRIRWAKKKNDWGKLSLLYNYKVRRAHRDYGGPSILLQTVTTVTNRDCGQLLPLQTVTTVIHRDCGDFRCKPGL